MTKIEPEIDSRLFIQVSTVTLALSIALQCIDWFMCIRYFINNGQMFTLLDLAGRVDI